MRPRLLRFHHVIFSLLFFVLVANFCGMLPSFLQITFSQSEKELTDAPEVVVSDITRASLPEKQVTAPSKLPLPQRASITNTASLLFKFDAAGRNRLFLCHLVAACA